MNSIESLSLIKRAKYQLGAPVGDVELEHEQMYALIDSAEEAYDLLALSNKCNREGGFKDFWVSQYFIALCKEALGRIRGKFNGSLPIPGADIKLNYKELLVESQREKQFLRYLMLNDKNILVENYKPILVFYVAVGSLNPSEISEFLTKVKESMSESDDGFTKYFVTTPGFESRIECIYPVSGADNETKEAISRMETILKEMSNE